MQNTLNAVILRLQAEESPVFGRELPCPRRSFVILRMTTVYFATGPFAVIG